MKTTAVTDTMIPARWFPAVRVAWVAIMFLSLGVFIFGISPNFNELRVPCTGEECPYLTLSQDEYEVLDDLNLSLRHYAGYHVGMEIVFFLIVTPLAALIFWRMTNRWIGLMLSLTLLLVGTITSTSAQALVRLYPGLEWIHSIGNTAGILIVLLFFLFPDGRFVPRWTRWITLGLIVLIPVDLLFVLRNAPSPLDSAVSEFAWLACLIVGAFTQVFRYRRISTPVQRQQTKWVLLGLTIIVLMAIVWSLLVVIFPIQPGPARLAYNLSIGIQILLFLVFPLSVAFSILRYRLWDVDILINRTIVYGILTVSLAVFYFAIVVLLQSFSRALTGQGSSLTVVASTLAIAALFTPLRRRIQEGIDRRFYRQKYDAGQVMAQFAATVRDEIDLDRLAQALLRTVSETTQPESVTLWLKRAE